MPDRIYGFHAQQAVEKLFKILITLKGERYPFIHDLVDLGKRVTSLGETLPALPVSLETLTVFAVESRYEVPYSLSTDVRLRLRDSIALFTTSVEEKVSQKRNQA